MSLGNFSIRRRLSSEVKISIIPCVNTIAEIPAENKIKLVSEKYLDNSPIRKMEIVTRYIRRNL